MNGGLRREVICVGDDYFDTYNYLVDELKVEERNKSYHSNE